MRINQASPPKCDLASKRATPILGPTTLTNYYHHDDDYYYLYCYGDDD